MSTCLLGQEAGLLSSVRRLVDTLLVSEESTSTRGLPLKKRRLQEKSCRQKALEVLIKNRWRSQGDEQQQECRSLHPCVEISAHCFELRLQGRADLAADIERCLSRLQNDDSSELPPPILAVLKLLSCLKDLTVATTNRPREDKLEPFFPFKCILEQSSSTTMRTLSPGPFLVGEITEKAAVKSYTHYPASIFQFDFGSKNHSFANNPYVLPDLDLVLQTPGTGLTLLRVNPMKPPQIEIPPLELVADRNGRFLRVPRTLQQTEEVHKKVVTAKNTVKDVAKLDDIWEKIWEAELPERKTWESLGRLDPGREKPYLTELGAAGVHRSWIVAMENLRLVDPNLPIPALNVLSEEKFVSDVSYLIIGIASETFLYHDGQFKVKAGTCLDGITPEALQAYCEDFLLCGSICRRLEKMCGFQQQETSWASMKDLGLIYAGFLHGIAQYLQGYRTAVLNISKGKSLLQLSAVLAPITSQIQFLGRLCKVDKNLVEPTLPTGIQLLCYLFDRTLHINARDLYFVLVSIIRASAEPYFRFLERWIFHGVCRDEFLEFGLECRSHFLGSRSRLFWTSAYATTELPLDASVCREGNFISEIQQQVYLCGKSLNLLKLCQPHHHLCTPVVQKQPTIQLLVSPIQQAQLKVDCREYVEQMEVIATERTTSLRKQKEVEAESRQELLRVAHRRHKDQLEKIRQHRKSVMEEESRRKRIVFEGLRDQLMAERQRKAAEKEKKLQDDKMWAEFALKKAEEEVKREEAAKKEMEEYYQRLTKEAEKREERAKWKIRRLDLRSERIKFWRGENKKIQEFMKNLERNEETTRDLSMVAEELPPQSKSSSVWKSVRVQEDEMKNIVLVLEDQESNIVYESVTNLGGEMLTSESRQQMLTQNFDSLPEWTRTRLLENLSIKQSSDIIDNSSGGGEEGGSFLRRTNVTSSGKRKRPDSFMESTEKKRVEEGQPDSPLVYVSLAAALSKDDDDAVRRRPKELTVIDGRKRPTSKSIEEILYPSRFSYHSQSTPVTPSKTNFHIAPGCHVQPYTKSFDRLNSTKVEAFTSNMLPRAVAAQVDTQAFTPLTLLMENSILIPLRAQLSVVNASVLNFLLVDARVMNHLRALRSYLLFFDGEFAHHLSCSLFCLVRDATSEVLNPATLSRIVENALMSSTFGCKDPLSVNVGFVLRGLEAENSFNDIFKCLKLGYTTDWPSNIILTPDVVEVYGELFQFLLQLKKAVWGLEQVYVDLKNLRGFESSAQVRRVHLMRHDMLNFVNVTQNYVKTQVLDVSWAEFEKDIQEKVMSVDSLYDAHMRYLNKAVKRCILNRKAQPVQKILVDIFNIVANFSCLLTKIPWDANGSATHPSFSQVEESYDMFREYSAFLFSVVNKLAAKGNEYHLNELLLLLNYNGFYDQKKSV